MIVMADNNKAPYFYLPTFYKTNEIITTTNSEQEWYLDKNWKDHLVRKKPGSKTIYWIEKENSRTRIDADSLKYNDNDDAWEGFPQGETIQPVLELMYALLQVQKNLGLRIHKKFQ